MTDPPNVYRTRVRAHQTDLNGVMYHGAYLDIFDDARIETFRTLGYDYTRTVELGYAPIIRHVEVDYRAPARMDEMLSVTVRVPKVGRATLTILYECRRDDTLLAIGLVEFAFLSGGRPIRVPSDLRQVIERHAALLHGASET